MLADSCHKNRRAHGKRQERRNGPWMVELQAYRYGEGGCHINCPASTPQNCLCFLFFSFFFFNMSKMVRSSLRSASCYLWWGKSPDSSVSCLCRPRKELATTLARLEFHCHTGRPRNLEGYRQGSVSGFGWLLTLDAASVYICIYCGILRFLALSQRIGDLAGHFF